MGTREAQWSSVGCEAGVGGGGGGGYFITD